MAEKEGTGDARDEPTDEKDTINLDIQDVLDQSNDNKEHTLADSSDNGYETKEEYTDDEEGEDDDKEEEGEDDDEEEEEEEVIEKLDSKLFLTKEEIIKLTEAFEKFKDPKLPSIATTDLGSTIRYLGFTPTEKQIKAYKYIVDPYGLGVTDLEGVIETACRHRLYQKDTNIHDITLEEAEEAFQVFSPEGKAIKTMSFIQDMLRKGEPFNLEDIRTFIKAVDSRGTGKFMYQTLIGNLWLLDHPNIKRKGKGGKSKKKGKGKNDKKGKPKGKVAKKVKTKGKSTKKEKTKGKSAKKGKTKGKSTKKEKPKV